MNYRYFTRRPTHIFDHNLLNYSYNEKFVRQVAEKANHTFYVE